LKPLAFIASHNPAQAESQPCQDVLNLWLTPRRYVHEARFAIDNDVR